MSVYVGMDASPSAPRAPSIDQAGTIQRNRNLPSDPAELQPVLGVLPAGTPAAFEAAFGWGWLVDLLEDSSCNHTWSIPAAASRSPRPGCRNDKVDAETLAQLGARRSAARGPGRAPAGPGPAWVAAPPRKPGAAGH